MKKLVLLCSLFLSHLLTAVCMAQVSNDPKQIFTIPPTDFFHEAKMPAARVMWIKTKFVGEPLDLSESRPMVEFDAETAIKEYYIDKLGLDRSILETHRLVANFFHEDYQRAKGGGLYMAFLPRQAMSVTAQYSRFSNIAAHAMTMFEFPFGQQAILVDRVPELSRKNAHGEEIRLPLPIDGIFQPQNALKAPMYVSEVLLSIESTWTQGRGGYKLWNGLRGWYVNTLRVISKEARIVKTLKARKPDKVTQFLLNFNLEEASAVWEEALRMSMKVQYDPKSTMVYHLVFQNCSNVLMGIYERAVGVLRRQNGEWAIRKARRWVVGNTERFSRFYPILNHWALRHRGYMDKQLGLLNETADYKKMQAEYEAIKEQRKQAVRAKALARMGPHGDVETVPKASNIPGSNGNKKIANVLMCKKLFSL